jgi:hypothetical protein
LKGVVLGDDVATLTLGAPLVVGGGVAASPGADEADTADALGVVLGAMLGVVLGSAAARRRSRRCSTPRPPWTPSRKRY